MAVDFVANARSLGAAAFAREHRGRTASRARRGASGARTTLVYVPVVPAHVPSPGYSWWDVPIAEVSNDPGVRDARHRYLESKRAQRFHR